MKITWLGQASFKIQADGKVIYLDPFAGEDYSEAADIILVSHSHFDHCDGDKVKKIRVDSTRMFTPADLVPRFDSEKVEAGDSFDVEGIRIWVVKAYNVNKDFHPQGFGVGYVLFLEGKKVYFAGDTDLIPEMDEMEVNIALLPIGGTYTMDYKEAAEAAKRVKCKIAIPMHYGYGIVGTPEDADHFRELVEREDIEVKVLEMGKSQNI